jgi:hypothetical protein
MQLVLKYKPSLYRTYNTLKFWIFYDRGTDESPANVGSGVLRLEELAGHEEGVQVPCSNCSQSSVEAHVKLLEPDKKTLAHWLGHGTESAGGLLLNSRIPEYTKSIESVMGSVANRVSEFIKTKCIENGKSEKLVIDSLDEDFANVQTTHIFSNTSTLSTLFTDEMRTVNCFAVPSKVALYALAVAMDSVQQYTFSMNTEDDARNIISVLQNFAAFLVRMHRVRYSSDTDLVFGNNETTITMSEAFFTVNIEHERDDCEGLAQLAVAFLDKLYSIGVTCSILKDTENDQRHTLISHHEQLRTGRDDRCILDTSVVIPNRARSFAGSAALLQHKSAGYRSSARAHRRRVFMREEQHTPPSFADMTDTKNLIDEAFLQETLEFACDFAKAVAVGNIKYDVVCMAASSASADMKPDVSQMAGHASCLLSVVGHGGDAEFCTYTFVENTANILQELASKVLGEFKSGSYFQGHGSSPSKSNTSSRVSEICNVVMALIEKVCASYENISIHSCRHISIEDNFETLFFQKLYVIGCRLVFMAKVDETDQVSCPGCIKITELDSFDSLANYTKCRFGISIQHLVNGLPGWIPVSVPCLYREITEEFQKVDKAEFDIAEFTMRSDEILLPPPKYTEFLNCIDRDWRKLHHHDNDSMVRFELSEENTTCSGRAICHTQAVFDLEECKKDHALVVIDKIKTVCGKLGKQIGVRFVVSSTMAANCCVINVHGYA